MKHIIYFFSINLLVVLSVQAQQQTAETSPKDWVVSDLKKRSNDHLVFSVGYVHWLGDTEDMNIIGFNHAFGINFFYDIPFKSNPHFSVAPGVGMAFNRIYFNKVNPTLGSDKLVFKDVSNTDHADEQGLFYTSLDAQLELRYISNPKRSERSIKVALGLKLGLTLDAVNYRLNKIDADGKRLATGVFKDHDTRFFQFPSTSISLRVGYGVIGVFANYQLTGLFYPSSGGPNINPLTMGLVLSGL